MIYKFIKYDGNKYSFGITNNINKEINCISAKPIFKLKNERYRFLKGLEILISQGIDVFSSIEVLKNSNEYKSERKIIEKIYLCMEKGDSFYSALKKSTDLPIDYLSLIEVAELTDNLLEPLSEANRIRRRKKFVKKKIEGAISYPLFLFIMAIFMLIVMSNVVLPMFKTMFENFDADLPFITKITLNIGDFLSKNLILSIIVISLLLVLFILLKAVSSDFYILIEKYRFKYSIFKKIRQDKFYEMFFKKFSILYRRLENTSEVIRHIAKSEDNIFLRINLLKLDKGVAMGQDFVEIASYSNVFNEFTTALFTGVNTKESMKKVSENLSNYYKLSLDNRIEFFTRWASPIVTVIVGFIIGFMALGLILPIFSLSNVI